MTTVSQARGRFAPCVLIFAATLAAYWPALRGGFIWDDDGHVTRAGLRSLHGLRLIWTQLGATQQYYPVLHSAFWLEHRLWGDAPLGYHLLNVLLHATSACLLVVILSRLWADETLTRSASGGDPGAERVSVSWAALLAGLIFALHPVCVESVAWISEQKNTLSTVFYLLAALVYLRWRALSPSRIAYWLATLLFALALLTKSVTATLPAALLVILWWKNGRLGWRRDVVPLLPWFALALGCGLLTAWVERTYIGAQGAQFALGFGQRVLLAGRIVAFYLGKLIWPAGLIFVYPRWPVESWTLWRAVFPLGVVLLLAGAWLVRRRSRGPLAGLLFFAGSLFPALGFFNVYPFVFSYVADHFQYLASLGIFALAGWALDLGSGRLASAARGWGALSPARPAIAALLLLLGSLTWRQCRMYRGMETLYRTTVERNPASWLAQENLGVVLAEQGRRTEAAEHYRAALRLNPDYAETHLNYGNVLAYAHAWPEAVGEYRLAARLRPDLSLVGPDWAQAEYGWASELGNGGHFAEAIGHYEQALRLRPDYAAATAELGLAEVYAGRLGDAVAQLRKAARLSPDSAQAHAYLGLALAHAGRLPEAAAEYRESLRLNPKDRDVHYQLGLALKGLGQPAAAADEFEAARAQAEGPDPGR